MDLEESINAYHRTGVREIFISDLLRPKTVPGPGSGGVYYLKDDAASGLASRLDRDGVQFPPGEPIMKFAAALYGAINKIPLKQVGYGMLNATLPDEVARHLTPWEAVYAYAGIWAKKSATSSSYGFRTPDLKNSTLYQIVQDIIMRGMERIQFVHNREYESGRYSHRMEKVPHKAEVTSRVRRPTMTLQQLNAMKNPAQRSLF
ncbi:hypothetical protein JW898_04905 [Candidatus Woesearchaeota archaeon]|nr:hypothetical protein [Candidatus Woesearchaeota archaeon]